MHFIKKIIKSLIRISLIKDVKQFSFLLKDPIILIDVGSTGGIEQHFKEIEELLHVITFDPDPRATTIKTKGKFENFKIGLWSKKDQKNLYLTKFPQASTIYKLNDKILSSFLNYPCHKKIGEEKLEVDSMENILSSTIYPHFIKVDAEGADLEILKGAERYLSTSCLGVQIEVSFINRHENAPYFSDTDQYLRKYDFCLMTIEAEKWIRKNNIFSCASNPQLIWGNAIYMLSIETFIDRVSLFTEKKREILLTKFIIILLIHRFHDYAYEVCEKMAQKNLISETFFIKSKQFIKKSIPYGLKCYTKLFLGILISLLSILFLFPIPKKRKEAVDFFKSRIKNLAKLLLNIRQGPNNACV